jgi:7-carboxy-7-deazaguanine synthase
MNEQKVSKPVYVGHDLEVESFFTTIQGEGIFVGRPAFFIRLAGCNIQCPHCDTQYSHGGVYKTQELLDLVKVSNPAIRLVVITGGEPFRQNIGWLITGLHNMGYIVQIETNGTLSPSCIDYDHCYIVCSPKLKLDPFIASHAHALKYVLHADYIDPTDGLPTSTLGHKMPPGRPTEDFKGILYVQPIDVQDPKENARHLQATIEVAMKYGYTLCLQVHKIINME